jgi:type VI secretion system protein ImpL
VHPDAAILAQLERADRIRQMFFAPGGKTPELPFTVRLSNLDAGATRFYVDIDGQRLEVKPQAESRYTIVWPGPEKKGNAVAVFEDRVGAPEPANSIGGPWAWFRLIDATGTPSPQAPSDDLLSTLRPHTNYHAAEMTIEAANAAKNPFASREWRQFRCDP